MLKIPSSPCSGPATTIGRIAPNGLKIVFGSSIIVSSCASTRTEPKFILGFVTALNHQVSSFVMSTCCTVEKALGNCSEEESIPTARAI